MYLHLTRVRRIDDYNHEVLYSHGAHSYRFTASISDVEKGLPNTLKADRFKGVTKLDGTRLEGTVDERLE